MSTIIKARSKRKYFSGVSQKQQRAHEDGYEIIPGRIGDDRILYYAIFDGHDGPMQMDSHHVVDYCKTYLHKRIGDKFASIDLNRIDITIQAIKEVFIDFDKEMYDQYTKGNLRCGTTCTLIIIDDIRSRIYQVNLGDSRCIIFQGTNIIYASKDHKPTNIEETKRIKQAGSSVLNERIMGVLAVSRVFGDFDYKKIGNMYDGVYGPASAVPEVTVINIIPPLRIIMTSDAPYERDAFTDESLVGLFNNTILNEALAHLEDPGVNLLQIAAISMVNVIAPKTTDDVTILLITI